MGMPAVRRDCAQKRHEYIHARDLYSEVRRLRVPDPSALRAELGRALLAYYAAHVALHQELGRGRRRPN